MYICYHQTPIGNVLLASLGQSLQGLWIENQKYFANFDINLAIEKNELPVFQKTKEWLEAYFKGEKPAINLLDLEPIGNEFRQTVWNILKEIPYGEVWTYGEVARITAQRLNKPKMSSQAVGGAIGHNPISIIVPCHRVVGTNGSLTGYAGGLHLKQKLLRHEQVDMTGLFMPRNA